VLAAGICSATLPKRYMSTAVLRLSARTPAGSDVEQRMELQHHLQTLQQGALSRHSLTSILVAQNLYPNERKTLPLEDVIKEMRNRDVES